ncbi:hypothetical protein VNO78_25919 [Psophocarpus tetragonolobus]|uniref:Uncharacterized protein n=1 Tax=Psophocarpus tetragonolobus TaxID=3891 RepID=A0AAN9S7A5_PSOTE
MNADDQIRKIRDAEASLMRRKQRNDMSRHGMTAKTMCNTAEKLRFETLKAVDHEAYMRTPFNTKKTQQSDGIEPLEDSETDLPESGRLKNAISKESPLEEDVDVIDSDHNGGITNDLLEG